MKSARSSNIRCFTILRNNCSTPVCWIWAVIPYIQAPLATYHLVYTISYQRALVAELLFELFEGKMKAINYFIHDN